MPKSRPHGTGFLRKRGNSWELRWYVDGEKRYSTVHGSKRDAERVLRERIREAERGEALRRDASSLSVGDLLQMKLERDKKRRISSLPAVESRMHRLIPAFAAVPAAKLRRGHIEAYAEVRLHETKPATVNRDLELIRAALRLALEEDPPLIHRAPKIEMLPVDNARTGFLDATDYERLRDACVEPWMRLLFVIAYHTGARPGAILAATWDRVDWGQMAVRPPAGTPRNKKVGSWPIYGDFERELRKAAMERDRLWPDIDHVIHRNGEPLKGYDSYRNAWANALDRAGLQNVLLYDMRRTAASNLLSAGIDPATVCLIVGWRSMQTMMRYVQLPDSRLKAAGKKADTWLSSERSEVRTEPIN